MFGTPRETSHKHRVNYLSLDLENPTPESHPIGSSSFSSFEINLNDNIDGSFFEQPYEVKQIQNEELVLKKQSLA